MNVLSHFIPDLSPPILVTTYPPTNELCLVDSVEAMCDLNVFMEQMVSAGWISFGVEVRVCCWLFLFFYSSLCLAFLLVLMVISTFRFSSIQIEARLSINLLFIISICSRLVQDRSASLEQRFW